MKNEGKSSEMESSSIPCILITSSAIPAAAYNNIGKTFQKSFIKNASQLLHDENLNIPLSENHSSLFSADDPAYQTGLPPLHVSEVISGETVC